MAFVGLLRGSLPQLRAILASGLIWCFTCKILLAVAVGSAASLNIKNMEKPVRSGTGLGQLGSLTQAASVRLVLSGGGVKGVAHVALIEQLEQLGIRIAAISGSSAGALVGAMYSSGLGPADMLNFFKSTPLFRYTWLSPTKPGVFDSDRYAMVLKDFVYPTFEELKIPLHIAATNLQQCRAEYFSQGDLLKPLLASCAVPAVFSPVAIEGELYAYGGVLDNFPIQPFLGQDGHILGSYICRPSAKSEKELNTIFKVTSHANNLLLYAANEYKFSKIWGTIVFPLGEFGAFESKRVDEIYEKSKKFLDQHQPTD